MKKTISVLCGLTILSACGTDKSNLVDAPRHAPALNGSPQTGPVSDLPVNNQRRTTQTAQASGMSYNASARQLAPYKLSNNTLVPPPVFLNQPAAQQATPQVQPLMVANSSSESNGRRIPELNRNALGKGSTDLLGPAPAPAVSKIPLSADPSITASAPPPVNNEPEIAETPKLQSVAASMPQGKLIPPAPSKNAVVPPLPQMAQAPAPAPAKTLMPNGPTVVVSADGAQPAPMPAPAPAPRVASTPDIHDVPPVQSVAANMPQGSVLPPAPPVPANLPPPKPVTDIHDTAPLQATAQNMPQSAIVPPPPAVRAPAPAPAPEVHDVTPVQSVADNMPRDSFVPAPPVNLPPPQPQLEVRDVPPVRSAAQNMPQGSVVPSAPSLASNNYLDRPPVPQSAPVPVAAPALVAANDNNNVGQLLQPSVEVADHVPVEATPAPPTQEEAVNYVLQPTQTVVSAEPEPQPVAAAPVQNVSQQTLVAEAHDDLIRPPTDNALKAADQPPQAPEVIAQAAAPTPMLQPPPAAQAAPVAVADNSASVIPPNDNSKYDQYPKLSEVPPAPPKPQPVDSDSRVKQMKQDLQFMHTDQAETLGTPVPPPVAPVETKTTVTQVQTTTTEPVQVTANQGLPTLPGAVNAPAPTPPAPEPVPAPVQVQAAPQNILPKGPTVVVSADDSAPAPEPLPVPTAMQAAPPPPPAIIAPPPAPAPVPVGTTTTTTIEQVTTPAPVTPLPVTIAPPAPVPVTTTTTTTEQTVTRGRPAGFLVPPSATTAPATVVSTQTTTTPATVTVVSPPAPVARGLAVVPDTTTPPPMPAPLHQGNSITFQEQMAPVNSSSNSAGPDLSETGTVETQTHSGYLKESRYSKLRQEQRDGSSY